MTGVVGASPVVGRGHPRTERNTDIEALRGYAVAITFVAHLGALFPAWNTSLNFFYFGGGVDLFFAISGYVITSLLLRELRREPRFTRFGTKFWVRRIFRLWPAALFWSSIVTVLAYTWLWAGNATLQSGMLASWLFSTLNVENLYLWHCFKTGLVCPEMPNWHYWSLSLEEQFYLLIPILIFALRGRAVLILPILVLGLWQSSTVRFWPQLKWYVRTDALCYGVVVAMLWHHFGPQMVRLFGHLPRLLLQVTLWTLLAGIALATPWASVYFMGLVAAAAGITVLIVSGNGRLLTASDWTRKAALGLGSRSYSFYLVHFPVLVITHNVLVKTNILHGETPMGAVAGIAMTLCLSVLIAEFSYRVIESPSRTFGRRLTEDPMEPGVRLPT
jgi:peptidoglycan/LPS O-acetylase OafA/YrhL